MSSPLRFEQQEPIEGGFRKAPDNDPVQETEKDSKMGGVTKGTLGVDTSTSKTTPLEKTISPPLNDNKSEDLKQMVEGVKIEQQRTGNATLEPKAKYDFLIGHLSRESDPERALETAKMAHEAAQAIPDPVARCNALFVVSSHLLDLGQKEKSLETVVEAASSFKDYPALMKMPLIMLLRMARQYNEMSKQTNNLDYNKQAFEIAQKAFEAAQSPSDDQVTDLLHVSLCFLELGFKEKAIELTKNSLQIAKSVPEARIRQDLLRQVSLNFIKSGDLTNSLEIANSFDDPSVKIDTLLEILEECRKNKTKVNENEIIKMAFETVTDSKYHSLSWVLRLLHLAGDSSDKKQALEMTQKALEVAQAIPDETARMSALDSLAVHLEAGTFDPSEVRINLLLNLSRSYNLLSSSTKNYNLLSFSKRQSLEIAQKALSVVESIHDGDKRVKALLDISMHYLNLADKEMALRVTRHAVTITQGMQYRANARKDIVDNLLKLDELKDSIFIANSIDEKDLKAQALMNLSRYLIKSGNHQMALEMAQKSREVAVTLSTLNDLKLIFLELGEEKQAAELEQIIANKSKLFSRWRLKGK